VKLVLAIEISVCLAGNILPSPFPSIFPAVDANFHPLIMHPSRLSIIHYCKFILAYSWWLNTKIKPISVASSVNIVVQEKAINSIAIRCQT